MNAIIKEVLENFECGGEITYCEPFGSGHINETRLVKVEGENGKCREYVLQKINKNVFKDPASLMDNFVAVTRYLKRILKESGEDYKRKTLNHKRNSKQV